VGKHELSFSAGEYKNWHVGRQLSIFKLKGRLYSYPYLNQQKPLFLSIIAYTLSTTKLEIRAK
jgi:hypothetical protein